MMFFEDFGKQMRKNIHIFKRTLHASRRLCYLDDQVRTLKKYGFSNKMVEKRFTFAINIALTATNI